MLCTVYHLPLPNTGLLQRALVSVTHVYPRLAPRGSSDGNLRQGSAWGPLQVPAYLIVLLPSPSSRAAHQHLHKGRAIVPDIHMVYLLLLL